MIGPNRTGRSISTPRKTCTSTKRRSPPCRLRQPGMASLYSSAICAITALANRMSNAPGETIAGGSARTTSPYTRRGYRATSSKSTVAPSITGLALPLCSKTTTSTRSGDRSGVQGLAKTTALRRVRFHPAPTATVSWTPSSRLPSTPPSATPASCRTTALLCSSFRRSCTTTLTTASSGPKARSGTIACSRTASPPTKVSWIFVRTSLSF